MQKRDEVFFVVMKKGKGGSGRGSESKGEWDPYCL